MNFKKEKLLIISPHADDEVLGCSGLIDTVKKHGGEVYVQILTLGGYRRTDSKTVTKDTWKKEFDGVSKYLNIDGYDIMLYRNKIQWLDSIPVSQIIGYLESKSKISLYKLQPTIVAVPTIFSTHQDHTQAYKASISALRSNPHEGYLPPKMILSYESPEYYFWSPYIEFGKFSPNFYIPMPKQTIEKKISALELYQSQTRKGKRNRDTIISHAIIRGKELEVKYAEAYHIHKLVF